MEKISFAIELSVDVAEADAEKAAVLVRKMLDRFSFVPLDDLQILSWNDLWMEQIILFD